MTRPGSPIWLEGRAGLETVAHRDHGGRATLYAGGRAMPETPAGRVGTQCSPRCEGLLREGLSPKTPSFLLVVSLLSCLYVAQLGNCTPN